VSTHHEGNPVPKILVADDNANIQKMVVLAFEERGIQVVSVGNGEAAVRRIPDFAPDLVLADIFMPVRNGYEVCEFVKKDERFSHVPVILLVGAFDPLDEKEARRVGADGVLKKPFVPPDPLIAMVMSALEKNPRIAAELAKAKEAKEVVQLPPTPELQIPARAEPKPLPEFPEPSPEEAALVYGFGKGRRTLEDDQPEAAAEPKAPHAEAEEAEDAEFDGAATSRDWRRNAMDFEVPADAANKPAFSSDDLEPITFPSERDFPPRHVRASDTAEEHDPVVQDKAPVPAPASKNAGFWHKASQALAAPASPVVEETTPEADATPTALFASEAAEEVREVPAVESETKSESSMPPSAAHWMDAVATSESGYPHSDWMNALSEQPVEPAATATAHVEAGPENPPTEALAFPAQPIEAFDARVEEIADQPVVQSVNAPAAVAPETHEASDEGFFADEPMASEPHDSWFAPAPPVFEPIEETTSAPVAIAASHPDQQLEADANDKEPIGFKDPALDEPPAVHVTPEPLLVDETPSGPSLYGSHQQEVSPLHSFFAPASGDPVLDEGSEEEASANVEIPAPTFEPRSEETNERIPTGPPPSREALAEIPFLTPPADFRADVSEAAASSPETVDAVVRKVLEKLEPQLHDLLSQGLLKPLVENILQSELAKKGK